MFFDIKSSFLLGLAATSVLASPVKHLASRAKIPANGIDCGDGQTFSSAEISGFKTAAKQNPNASKKFGNKSGGAAVFPNHPATSPGASKLWEYAIPDKSGSYNKYRLVINDGYDYVGVMVHTAGLSNGFRKCNDAAPPKPSTPDDQEKDGKDKDGKDKKPDGPSGPDGKTPGAPPSAPDGKDGKDGKKPQNPSGPDGKTPDAPSTTPDNKDGSGSGGKGKKKGGRKGGK